jgi:hypothetical protein
MAKPIFVNAAVSDLARATAFYEAIGANVPVEANNWLAHMHGTVVHSKLSFGPFELTIGTTALMAPSPAQAWRGGWGGGLAGGLIAGALIGGIASSAYAYGPGTVSLARRNGPHLYRTMGPVVHSRHSGLRITFKHRRQGYFQNTANAEQPRRTDPVVAGFIFLNLLP